jgi:hypothetical protein
VRDCLLAIHLVGLCFAVGAAFRADLALLRALRGRLIAQCAFEIARREAGSIRAGYLLLTFSGAGYLFYFAVFEPHMLANPKIVAKLACVVILALNGAWLERCVLGPGRPWALRPQALVFALAVSWTTWSFAFALGVARSANHVVTFATWFGAYVLSLGVIVSILFRLTRDRRTPRLTKASAKLQWLAG